MRLWVVFLSLLVFSFLVHGEVNSTFNTTCVGCLYGETVSSSTTTMTTTTTTTTLQQQSQNLTTTTTVTTTTTILEENQTSTTTTTIKTETYTFNQSYSEKNIKDSLSSESLKNKIKEIFKDVDTNKIPKLSEEIKKDINIKRTIIVSGNNTIVILSIDYHGDKTLKKFMIYEDIPKNIAKDASKVHISTNLNYVVVNSDPSFLFYIEETSQTIKSITYRIDKPVNKDLFNGVQTVVMVGEIKGANYSWLVWIVVIIVVAAVLYIFKDKIISYYERKIYVMRGLGKKEPKYLADLRDKINEFIERFRGKKKRKFAFKPKR